MKFESGNTLERVFYSNCGTPICPNLKNRTVWKAGLFNHLKDLEVVANVWTKSVSKLSYVDMNKESYKQGG